jgi:anti-sigma factor RsiW
MTFSDEDLMAYADGELDDIKRKQIEDAINRDPNIARRVAAERALKDALSKSFDPVLQEPVPDRLMTAARSAARSPTAASPAAAAAPPAPQSTQRTAPQAPREPKSNVVPLRGRGAPTRQQPRWIALAASFILGALALQLITYLRNKPETDAQLIGSGALQRALSTQLASEQTNSPVQIGVSFLAKSGNYCRTFRLKELGGLACNEAGTWKLQVLARTAGANASQYKPAASDMPPTVVQAVNDTLSGEPLDSKMEAAVRAQKWQHAN